MKDLIEFAECLMIAALCTLMILPSQVWAYGGMCVDVVSESYKTDTRVCINGICLGDIKEYPTRYACEFAEKYPDGSECSNTAVQYRIKVTPVEAVRNETWSRWISCVGADLTCVACVATATTGGVVGGFIVGGTAGSVGGPPGTVAGGSKVAATVGVALATTAAEGICYFACGELDAFDKCCMVDCLPDTKHISWQDYGEGCK